MFHYDGGLKLTSIDLAIDVRRRQPRGFISHAHSDHMGRHELAVCTPATAQLYRHRLGDRRVMELPLGVPLDWGPLRLTAYPAGHVFGSAMLLADDGEHRLLYTGDFKLGPSATSGQADPPTAEVLVMETTFGDPQYRLPPRDEVIQQLIGICVRAISDGIAPVIHAYTLGKAQEVTRILTMHGISVQQHPVAFAVSQVYQANGCLLGEHSRYEGHWDDRSAIVMPPRNQKSGWMPLPARCETIGVSGWAMARGARYRFGVDHMLPLSDHADYDDLLECIVRVEPRVIFCTHGPAAFVDHLRELGHNAHPLDATSCFGSQVQTKTQRALF